jgi:hypothetical protein
MRRIKPLGEAAGGRPGNPFSILRHHDRVFRWPKNPQTGQLCCREVSSNRNPAFLGLALATITP